MIFLNKSTFKLLLLTYSLVSFYGCSEKTEIVPMLPNNDYIIFDTQINDKERCFYLTHILH